MRAGMIRPPRWLYETASSTMVITARTRPMSRYCLGRRPCCSGACSVMCAIAAPPVLSLRGHQVDDGENHDPDDIDEVPVQTGNLDVEALIRAEAGTPHRCGEDGA